MNEESCNLNSQLWPYNTGVLYIQNVCVSVCVCVCKIGQKCSLTQIMILIMIMDARLNNNKNKVVIPFGGHLGKY